VLDLYAARDPELGKVLANGLGAAGIARSDRDGMNVTAHVPGYVRAMRDTAHSVARIMAADDGPRVGALAFGGWDTHANQGAATGQLARLLSGLDTAFGAFETGFGPVWQRTAVVVITEFGRTARVNGTIGSDHGTGTVAVLLGGAVRGGRVLADWPGLGPSQLYENRDLAATTDLRAVLKGVLQQGYDLNESFLANTVFPGTGSVRPMRDLLI
jgi:uncharacterized protein (DUF1501 family)